MQGNVKYGWQRHIWAGGLGLVLLASGLGGCESANKDPSLVERDTIMEKSDEEFAKGASRQPSARTLYAMSRVLMAERRDAEADYTLQRLVQEHPTYMPAYCDLAELRIRQRRLDEASKVLETGLKISPKEHVLLNDQGMIAMLRGNYPAALEKFAAAAALKPDNTHYRANMAVALGMQGRYEESLTLYQQILPPAEAHQNVAVLCEANKDTERAELEYKIADDLKLSEKKAKPQAAARK